MSWGKRPIENDITGESLELFVAVEGGCVMRCKRLICGELRAGIDQ